MRIAFLGLSVTSSWGNGHATNYRALMAALDRQGHDVTFLERDKPWYAAHRDLPRPPWGITHLYDSLEDLQGSHRQTVAAADLTVVGSFVPEGIAVGAWAIETCGGSTAFFDIDTPVTLAGLLNAECEYIDLDLIKRYDLYLSFTGGPVLERIEAELGARAARAFYCVVDEDSYSPRRTEPQWDLGYLGTYSPDRQPTLEKLMLDCARAAPELSFIVAGPGYPEDIEWPGNVSRRDHLSPPEHPGFYRSQRFTLNVTRRDMVEAGFSPSVRLFEAAACGVPVISDRWPGIEEFFRPGEEILLAEGGGDVCGYLREMGGVERDSIASRARERVLAEHSATKRVQQLLSYVEEVS